MERYSTKYDRIKYTTKLNTVWCFAIFRQADPVQLKAGLNRCLHKQQQGQITTLGATFPPLWEKCEGSLTSPTNQYREEIGDWTYGLSSLSEETRMSNH